MSISAQSRVRLQLAWLNQTPNLIYHSDLEAPQGLFGQVFNPISEPRFRARRLGLQFEELVKLHLKSSPYVSDIESNIPVRESKITLGEADLLLQFQQQWWHLELALKFYLRQPGIEGLAGYFGPNRRDRFDLKWAHMLNHQSKILHHESARPLLEKRSIERVNSAILMKGWLFQHPEDLREHEPEPINATHQRGWWVHSAELADWLNQFPPNARYLIVEKPYWLYPLPAIAKPALNREQLLTYISSRTFPTQVWVVLGEGVSRQLLSRGYVVSDDWESSDD